MVEAARKWMWAVLAMTLVLGMGLGVLLDRLVLEPTVYSRSSDVRGGRRQVSRDRDHQAHLQRFTDRLKRELTLTDAQSTAVEEMVNTNHETARAFWRESRSQFRDLREKFRDDLRAVLTEEQRTRFDQMLSESESEHEHDRRDRERNQ